MGSELTKAQRTELGAIYHRARTALSRGAEATNKNVAGRLYRMGLVDRQRQSEWIDRDTGRVSYWVYSITDLGRASLAKEGKSDD